MKILFLLASMAHGAVLSQSVTISTTIPIPVEQYGIWSVTGSSITAIPIGTQVVTPGTGTWSVGLSGNQIITVTPGTGTVSVVPPANANVTVTPGSGTWTTSPPAGLNYTVTPGSGTWPSGLTQTYSTSTAVTFTAASTVTVTGSTIAVTFTVPQPVYSTSTAIIGNVGVTAVGVTPVTYASGTWVIDHNGKYQPVYSTSTFTVDFNGKYQPVYSTGISVGYYGNQIVSVTPGTGTFSTSITGNNIFTATAGTGTFTVGIGDENLTVTPGSGTFTVGIGDENLTVTPGSGTFNVGGSSVVISQSATFIAYSTAVTQQSTTHFTLINQQGSAVVIKIRSIQIQPIYSSAVTGLNTSFLLNTVTGYAKAVGNAVMTRKMDSLDAALNANVIVTTGPTSLFGLGKMPLASVTASSEETSIQTDPKWLYLFTGKGERPLTLRAGEGIVVNQGALPMNAGFFAIETIFTQE